MSERPCTPLGDPVTMAGLCYHPPMMRHPYHFVAMLLLTDALAAVVTVLILFRTVLA